MTQDTSNKITTQVARCKNMLRSILLLLMMVVGVNTAWGQISGTNYGEIAINKALF